MSLRTPNNLENQSERLEREAITQVYDHLRDSLLLNPKTRKFATEKAWREFITDVKNPNLIDQTLEAKYPFLAEVEQGGANAAKTALDYRERKITFDATFLAGLNKLTDMALNSIQQNNPSPEAASLAAKAKTELHRALAGLQGMVLPENFLPKDLMAAAAGREGSLALLVSLSLLTSGCDIADSAGQAIGHSVANVVATGVGYGLAKIRNFDSFKKRVPPNFLLEAPLASKILAGIVALLGTLHIDLAVTIYATGSLLSLVIGGARALPEAIKNPMKNAVKDKSRLALKGARTSFHDRIIARIFKKIRNYPGLKESIEKIPPFLPDLTNLRADGTVYEPSLVEVVHTDTGDILEDGPYADILGKIDPTDPMDDWIEAVIHTLTAKNVGIEPVPGHPLFDGQDWEAAVAEAEIIANTLLPHNPHPDEELSEDEAKEIRVFREKIAEVPISKEIDWVMIFEPGNRTKIAKEWLNFTQTHRDEDYLDLSISILAKWHQGAALVLGGPVGGKPWNEQVALAKLYAVQLLQNRKKPVRKAGSHP